jgi:two-component system sensor histidine kinase KdpD
MTQALPSGEPPPRGKLKIFFGAFPGAGKTNAMLNAAQRMRDSGRDVVAGVVDSHESADRVLLEGFESLATPAPGATRSAGTTPTSSSRAASTSSPR